MDTNIEKNAKAAEWLKMAEGKWRLQTLQHRGRYNVRTGEYKELPTRLRRFLNGTPVGLIGRTLEILKSQAPYRSPVFNWEHDDGLEYRPTNTLIRKDGPEMTTNGKDATYTIIQDLRLAGEDGETVGITEDSSCSRLTTAEYHWDESSVIDCPQGGQGVSYSIQNVNREGDTDLFSYSVKRTVAITQHVPEHTVQCSSRRRTTVETWDNVYGSRGDYRHDLEVNAGAPVPIPEPCDRADGTSVEVTVQENADCTFKIQISRTYAYSDDRSFNIYKDQYKIQDTTSDVNQPAPLPRTGTDYSGGVITRYSSERNDDGTWNNSVEVETERSVPESSVETRVTPRFSATTVTDTNQPEPVSRIPGVYGSFKVTKTPGGLYNNERTTYVRNIVDRLGLSCEKTAFVHSHEYTGTVESLTTGHAGDASNGKVTSFTYSTDETTGAVTRSVRTKQELTVDEAVMTRSFTLRGVSSSYSGRSLAYSKANSLLGGVKKPGDSVTVKMTEGRMWDVEVSSFSATANSTLSAECEKTFYHHVHSIVRTALSVGEDAADAGDGYVRRRSYEVDVQTGSVTVSDRYTKEIPRAGSAGSVRIGSVSVTTSTVNTQVKSRSAVTRPGQSVEWRTTDGGLITETVTESSPREGAVARECSRTKFQHQHSTTTAKATGTVQDVSSASGGVIRQESERLDDSGVWTHNSTVTTELPVPGSSVEHSMTARGLTTRTVNTQVAAPSSPAPSNSAGSVGRSRRVDVTPGGLVTETVTVTEPLLGKRASECTDDLFRHQHSSTETARTFDPGSEVNPASGGTVMTRSASLTDGGWDVTTRTVHEHLVDTPGARRSKDAFGETVVHECSGTSNVNMDGGVKASGLGSASAVLQSVERTRTPGNLNNMRVTTETPIECHTPWFESKRTWYNDDNKFTSIQRWVEFRNATETQVNAWLREADNHDFGTYSNSHVTVTVNPSFTLNRFKLYDGRISASCSVGPKGQAGGTTERDNWQRTITFVNVTFSPLKDLRPPGGDRSQWSGHLLKTTTETTRIIGAGVGDDLTKKILPGLGNKVVEGSQITWDAAGKRFQYNIIKSVKVINESVEAKDHDFDTFTYP